jgi:hypothetical protein
MLDTKFYIYINLRKHYIDIHMFLSPGMLCISMLIVISLPRHIPICLLQSHISVCRVFPTIVDHLVRNGCFGMGSFAGHSNTMIFPVKKKYCNPTTNLLRRRGERSYSSYSFTTSALDEGEWSVSRPGRALPPGRPPVPTGQEAGWAPQLVWTRRIEEKSSCLCRGSNLDRPVVQSLLRFFQ